MRTCLACQMAVQDGMSITMMPAVSSPEGHLRHPDAQRSGNKTSSISILKRRSAETAMPAPKPARQQIDVREGVWKASLWGF